MIQRAAALALLLATLFMLRLATSGDLSSDLRGTALAFGFALIAAVLAGDILERLRLPRISGYLLFGLASGPFAADLISRVMAADLQQINGLAVALIAFVAGLEMNVARLRSTLAQILRLSVVVLGGSLIVFTLGFTLFWQYLPLPAGTSTTARLAIALVVALLVVSFSPTVTIAVITESRARGPLSRLVMALVIVADLLLIVVFALALQLVRWSSDTGIEQDVGPVAALAWELVGSVSFGAAIGAAFAFYLRMVAREVTIVLIGVCMLLAIVGRFLHFEIVLASLTAGLVVENIAPPKGDALRLAVERGALPVLVVFFVAAGASLQLDALAAVGGIALAIAVVRAGLLYLMSQAGIWWSNLPEPAALSWMGLVSQGGVTVGLASIVSTEFPEWGPPVYTLIIALTAIHVLVGPVLFRAALSRAGEIRQAQ
jgi:Kef-type K+ transport system membrane component KefB